MRSIGLLKSSFWMTFVLSSYAVSSSIQTQEGDVSQNRQVAECNEDWTNWVLSGVKRRDCTVAYTELDEHYPCLAVRSQLSRHIYCTLPLQAAGVICKYGDSFTWKCTHYMESIAFVCFLNSSSYLVQSLLDLNKDFANSIATHRIASHVKPADLTQMSIDKCYRLPLMWDRTIVTLFVFGVVSPVVGLLVLLWLGHTSGWYKKYCTKAKISQLFHGFVKENKAGDSRAGGTYAADRPGVRGGLTRTKT
ncbi:hypothetical protein CSKR_101795 [Clonorchis sinensis]|uniref:Uncharacterized protein n=1 Tax=Clonorchis sinensis TaxID=79923 RepID=A0A3R7CN28_CLOSI|nr:hypothetical protein CSKR_101795 [Clonorchis sinensis]